MPYDNAQVKKNNFFASAAGTVSGEGPLRRVDGAAPFTRLSLQKLHKCGNLSLL